MPRRGAGQPKFWWWWWGGGGAGLHLDAPHAEEGEGCLEPLRVQAELAQQLRHALRPALLLLRLALHNLDQLLARAALALRARTQSGVVATPGAIGRPSRRGSAAVTGGGREGGGGGFGHG